MCDLTPRLSLVRQVLLAAAAIGCGDPATASTLAGVLAAARREGFRNTVIATVPQVTGCLIEHPTQMRPDPFTEQPISAALDLQGAQPVSSRPGRGLAELVTQAGLRVLRLLPTSSYLQMAVGLYISRNTVKTHLRAICQKPGVASCEEAVVRAVDLRLL